ncbi:uncharacterized protein LOC131945170 [Physella acuta]|uniref:uncharacterized protein LOC131945170 n=1 Tax=Physella acuta TaxID=109671 RepID=UPI0027DC1A96|nr:uncharacterized protein LOC131945170 [Physella acuta]
MPPLYQIKTIRQMLDHLEHQREVVSPVLHMLNMAIDECQYWINDGDHLYGSENSGQTEANISSTNSPMISTNVVASLEPSQQDNTEDKTCSKFVTIEELQSLLHKLDITYMATGSLERKYLQIEENINTVNDKLTRFDGKLKSQAKKLKQQDRRVEEIEKNMDVLTEKVEEQYNATQRHSDNIRQIMTSIQEINEASCDNKKHIEELSVVTKDLVKKTNDHETSVQDILESLSRTDTKLTNAELKVTIHSYLYNVMSIPN